MAVYRVGLIGCGWVAPFHLAALARLKERAEVVWVVDPAPERAESIAQLAGARVLNDYHEGLGNIDCAFVLTPHHLHHRITVDCLNAGCHVLLEKPMAITVEEADEMVAAGDRAGKVLMIGYPNRYRTSMQVFHEAVASGRYGKPFMLDGFMDESVQGYITGWIAKKETLGGGVFFSTSTHMLEVMLWIAGDVQTLSMVGTKAGVPIEGEDTAAAVMKFKNGAIGVIRHTWASPKTRIHFTMQAMCEKAHVIMTQSRAGDLTTLGVRCPWLTRVVAVGETEEVLFESSEGLDFEPEIVHFLDCVDTGRRPDTDGIMGRKIVALVREAYRKADAVGGNI